MGREDGKPSTGRFVLLGRTKRPKGDRPAAELGEPTFELGLCGVVRKARHMQNLAALGEEGADISASIHGSGENVGVLVWRLGLADEAAEHSGKSDSLLHRTARRCRSEGLQVEGKVVLDGGAGLHGFNLERGANIGQGGRSERKGFGVVLLPALILGAEVEGPRVLEVRRKDYRLVAGFPWELDTQVPGLEGDEDEVEVLRGEVLGGEGIEAVDGITEGAGISYMFPGQGRQARWRGRDC